MSDQTPPSIDVNFFKPKTGLERDNSKMIITFLIIWAVAVFGFQFLLKGTSKMTPEESLVTFNQILPDVQAGTATVEQKQDFGRSLLMMLGKNTALAAEDVTVLRGALTFTVASLGGTPEPESAVKVLNLGAGPFDQLMIELMPVSLLETVPTALDDELADVMTLYGTHPRGPLTDFTFLGFPFHYWYTVQFLLILFVLLCYLYTRNIEKLYRKHNYVEEDE